MATWTITGNVVCASDTVAFYAIPPGDPDELLRALREYQREFLPSDVQAEYESAKLQER